MMFRKNDSIEVWSGIKCGICDNVDGKIVVKKKAGGIFKRVDRCNLCQSTYSCVWKEWGLSVKEIATNIKNQNCLFRSVNGVVVYRILLGD